MFMGNLTLGVSRQAVAGIDEEVGPNLEETL